MHVRKVPGPATTVTQTVQASTPTATPPTSTTPNAGGGAGGPLSFSGNGIKNLGTINVPVDSIIKWTDDGGFFSILDTDNAVEVSSQASSGQSDLAAGTYHGFEANAGGNWTIDIIPK